jgi:2-methylcitrate dehydratase PrpD
MTYKKNICTTFSENICKLKWSHLNNNVIYRVKLSIIDYMAALMAGVLNGPITPILSRYISLYGGRRESSVVGWKDKISAFNAALINGAIAHSVELDDGHRFGTAHPAVAIMPAVFAVAERSVCFSRDIILSIIVGYEVMLRLATAINPGHWRRGFHSTGTCGTIGAAAAVAKLLNLSTEKNSYAISIGALQSAGLQQMLYSHPMIKPIQPGKAALAGIISADLAALGAKSPENVFEGSLGFFKAMTDKVCTEGLGRNFHSPFEIERTYFKLYPSCRHVHCSIDLVRILQDKYNIIADEIKKIQVQTYSIAAKEVGKIILPNTPDEAMFSIPYCVSVWLFEKSLECKHLRKPYIIRKDILQTAKKISVYSVSKWNNKYPNERGATMIITLKNGRALKKELVLPTGEPETMDSESLILDKFSNFSNQFFDKTKTKKLLKRILNLENEKKINFLLNCLKDLKIARMPTKNRI